MHKLHSQDKPVAKKAEEPKPEQNKPEPKKAEPAPAPKEQSVGVLKGLLKGLTGRKK